MPDVATFTTTIVDSVAQVCATAIGPDAYVFAAGLTDDVTAAEPLVVPIADDFTEVGMPAVTVALGRWVPLLQPGNERVTWTLIGAIWRPRPELGDNTALLYSDRDHLADAFLAHGKAFAHLPQIQSAVLMGGPGIKARDIPKKSGGTRIFLTLPFTVEVKTNRTVIPQPA